MKKFLFFFVLLLGLGAVGFFIGWVQFSVPVGTVGVMRSKTHGVDPYIIREGEFRWVWYKLIPTNVEIVSLTPKTISRTLKSLGSLPSGTVYADIAGINTDFSWEIAVDFSFRIRAQAIPALVGAGSLNTDDDLRILEADFARRVENFIVERINLAGQDPAGQEALAPGSAFQTEISAEIENAFPELEQINCRLHTVRFPDYVLYLSARGLYEEYLARQSEFLADTVTQNVESNIRSKVNLDELEKYGEILTRYPILLEFLALERELALEMLSGE